jgi:hypothetical protein
MSDAGLQVIDHFDPHHSAWRKLGDSRCPGHSIGDDILAIRPATDKHDWHANRRLSVFRYLSRQLERICARRPCPGQMQRARIDVKEYLGHSCFIVHESSDEMRHTHRS